MGSVKPELETIDVGTPVSVSFQRGKVLSQDMSNTGLVDAVAALQYLSKLRGAGWEEGEVNVVNMASILPPVVDQKTIIPNVKDVIALLQYLVGKRNGSFQLL